MGMGMGSESHHGNGMDLPPGGVRYGAHLAELNIAIAKDLDVKDELNIAIAKDLDVKD